MKDSRDCVETYTTYAPLNYRAYASDLRDSLEYVGKAFDILRRVIDYIDTYDPSLLESIIFNDKFFTKEEQESIKENCSFLGYIIDNEET